MIKIGRDSSCDIIIDERFDTVSNDHADIVLQNGVLTYTDHSTNGTVINGEKYKGQSVTISKGDSIKLAGVCELAWDTILQHFPELQRSTIALDYSTPEQPQTGRQTVGIGTQIQQDSTSGLSSGIQPQPSPAPQKKKQIDKTILWSIIGATAILIVYCLALFNDLIFNLF